MWAHYPPFLPSITDDHPARSNPSKTSMAPSRKTSPPQMPMSKDYNMDLAPKSCHRFYRKSQKLENGRFLLQK
jgi:hypothetical protein